MPPPEGPRMATHSPADSVNDAGLSTGRGAGGFCLETPGELFDEALAVETAIEQRLDVNRKENARHLATKRLAAEEPKVRSTLCWREMDSNFQYASTVRWGFFTIWDLLAILSLEA